MKNTIKGRKVIWQIRRALAGSIAARSYASLVLGLGIFGVVSAASLYYARFKFLAAVTVALSVMAPAVVLMLSGVLGRLRTLTNSMTRVALAETGVPIPFVADPDEIGDMARALEVFQSNAATLLQNAKEIEKLHRWFDVALNNMGYGLSMYDRDRKLVVSNRRYRSLYGVPDQLSLPGTPIEAIADHWRKQSSETAGEGFASWLTTLEAALYSGRTFSEIHKLTDGRSLLVDFHPLPGGGWIDLHEDITARITAEARVAELAEFDPVTGLANRHQLMRTLSQACAEPVMTPFALVALDLDKFKGVNDTLGHPAGDTVLREAGKRLKESVRTADLVARMGGDEFAVLLRGQNVSAESALRIARRMIAAISRAYTIAGQPAAIGASAGLALAPRGGQTAGDLLKNADVALYQAKQQRGTAVLFSSELEKTLRERGQLETELREALSTGTGLALHYQPVVDLKTRSVTSLEALMRWTHPRRGAVAPTEFIALAEETGLINELGCWALREACRDCRLWPDSMKVAVNFSARQFADAGLAGTLLAAAGQHGIAPSRIEVEITETALLQETEHTFATFERLKHLGVSIALDDFGTGYASLSTLRRFPFSKIKIDQTFVRDLPGHKDSIAIVRAITALCSSLGMRSVAEGVETREHLEHVLDAQCDEAQGYLFSRPVPAADAVRAIEACSSRFSEAA